MEEKLKLTVPTNEGQNVVGEEELKTLGDGVNRSGSIERYVDTSMTHISGSFSIDIYSWGVSGDVAYSADITEYHNTGSGCGPILKITFSWATLMLNLDGSRIIENLPNNRTKIISITGVSSLVIYNTEKGQVEDDAVECEISGNVIVPHFQVIQVIIDNESGDVISSTELVNLFNKNIKVTVKLIYNHIGSLDYDSCSVTDNG